MTIWKRERAHFNYYITNERKQPHIYVEALGTPSASTEKVLKDHGFKFDHNNGIIRDHISMKLISIVWIMIL